MVKNFIYFRLVILLLLLTITGGQVLETDAAPLEQQTPSEIIDEQVWQEILASPTRETAFLVKLRPEGDRSVDAQFRLEKMLALMLEAGSLKDYKAYYGQNIIKITAGAGVLNYLGDWPELESITAYTPGEEWELRKVTTREGIVSDRSSQVTGIVTMDDGTTPLSGIEVTAYVQTGSTTWSVAGSVSTNTSGDYSISSLEPGIYRVKFVDPSGNYVTEYYDDKPSFTLAKNIDVLEGETVSDINAALASAGKISGTITFVSGGTEAGLVAKAWSNASGSWKFISNAITNESGDYSIGGLTPGNYRVEFSDSSFYSPPRYATKYYDNQPDLDSADDVGVDPGDTTMYINAELMLISDVVTFAKQTNGEDVENAPGPYIVVGDSVNWTYIITNNSDGSFTFSIVDDPAVMISCPTNVLLSGESTTCTASATAVEGQFTNTATVTVTPPGDLIPFDIQDISHYFGYTPSGLNLTKFTNGLFVEEPPGPQLLIGNTVTWTYDVTNESNAPVTNLSVGDDDPAVMVYCAKNELEGNETITCSASGEVIEGQYSNSAQASGIFVPTEGEITSPTASSYYYGVIGSKLFLPLIMR